MLTSANTLSNSPPGALWSVLLLLGGIALLLIGGSWLVKGAVVLARRMGISTLVIGLTIVAFGTSTPELALNVVAAASGETGLAFGNVVGSNIANIGLVIGLSALVAPLMVSSQIIRVELPWLIFVTILFLLLTWLPPGVDGAPGYNLLDGILLFLGAIAITIHWFRVGRRNKDDALAVESSKDSEEQGKQLMDSMLLSWLALLGGLVLLVAGGKGAEVGAVSIATHLGVDEVIIGLTIVALATTLPEIAICVIASRQGHADLAVGTVVGSNLFNIVLVMGITSVIHPVVIPQYGWWALGAMTVFTLLLLPMAMRKKDISRFEGCVLLSLYVASIGGVIWLETSSTAG